MRIDPTFANHSSLDPDPIDRLAFKILEEDVAGNDPATMIDLIDSFINDGAELISNMTQGIKNQEIRKIELSAHSIKSTAAIFGASTLSQLSAGIEKMAHAGEVQALAEILQQASDEFQQVKGALIVEREKWVKAAS